MRKALAFVVLFVAFAGAMPTASAAEIGVILAGKVLGIWLGMTRGIERAAQDLHVGLVVRSPADGAALGIQRNIQLKLIDYMVQRGIAGIILAPEPLEGVATPVSIAVPTVLVDRSSPDYNAISTVATDNFAGGRTAALSLAPLLPKGAKIAVLRLAANISSTTERENGFVSVAREMGWEVVVDAYVGYRYRESQALVVKALNGYAGHLDAVFAPAEPVAYGALRVVEAMPVDARPRLVAFDWRPEFLDALKRGGLYATVLQDPYRMGYLAVETLVAATQGRPPPPPTQFVEVMTVMQTNVNDPAAQAAIANYSE
jgi:ribose transport system substrate-binding protein